MHQNGTAQYWRAIVVRSSSSQKCNKNAENLYLVEIKEYFIVGIVDAHTEVSFAQKLKIFLHTI